MEQVIKAALSNGMSRAEAYLLWSEAVKLKQNKVFQELMSKNLKEVDWREIEGQVRKYQLNQDQYKALRAKYFSY